METRICELCNSEAAVYCPSDSAFLCRSCDGRVHGANFLVARHVRHRICFKCNGMIAGDGTGRGFRPFSSTCSFCSPTWSGRCHLISGSSSSSSSSSSSFSSEFSICVSSTNTRPKEERRENYELNSSSSGNDSCGEITSKDRSKAPASVLDMKARGIFVNWCTSLGPSGDVAVRIARNALGICVDQLTFLPLRVCLAASIWLGLRFKGAPTRQALKRLEDISGVPAKLIIAVETKLELLLKARRARRRRQHQQLVEGWGES